MDNPSLTHLDPWRVCGIFAPAPRRDELIAQRIAYLRQAIGADLPVVRLASRRSRPAAGTYALEDMSTNRSNRFLQVMALLTATPSILVMDDIAAIRHYPQSMTRNIINHIAPHARYKITAGDAMTTEELADLYAEFAVLDKKILHASHYWCFLENHKEVSVFDGRRIHWQQDITYLAAKLRPFIYLAPDLPDHNPVEAQLFDAIRAIPLDAMPSRAHDISSLLLP